MGKGLPLGATGRKEEHQKIFKRPCWVLPDREVLEPQVQPLGILNIVSGALETLLVSSHTLTDVQTVAYCFLWGWGCR